jgi:hypothetical protein
MGLLASEELDRTLARKPEPDPVAEPVVAGPVAAAASTETTPSGLPRRGASQPVVTAEVADTANGTDTEEVEADAPAPAPVAPLVPTPAPSAPAAQPVAEEPLADVPAETTEPVTALASASPVAPAGPAPRPVNGFGGLAVTPSGPSLFSVAARQAREARESAARTEATVPAGIDSPATAGGLTRRVPGAQRPDAVVTERAPEPSLPALETTPEDVYSFLSNFQSGVARGRADAASENTPTNEENGL